LRSYPLPADFIVTRADPREKKKYYLEATPLRRVLTPVIKAIFSLIADCQVSGVERFPKSGPVVLAANHLTNFDVFPMQFALPRPIFYMGKEELFRNPIQDWLLRQLGGFPVYRGASDDWALRHARKVLEHGQVLGIFPEGKRSQGKGLHPAKSGAARFAIEAQCPLVPLAIYGPEFLFRNFPRRTKVSLTIGFPIYPKPDESPLALTDRLMFALAGMLPIHARGVYAQHPRGF
jgi:1-acyl-sn-glycerol-3-phosphate acyltransferase